MSSRSTFECFGLVIHGYGLREIHQRIDEAVSAHAPLWIVTANPEILLEAKRNPSYWQTIRQSDLRLVDGFGLQAIGWLFQASPKRVSGVNLSESLMERAERDGWNVAFLGGAPGVADKAAWTMRKRFPRLRVTALQGGHIDAQGFGDEMGEEALHQLRLIGPDLLLVAFGHPKQEAWIARHLAELPSVKVIVGVGGAFDYWAGTARRAPRWLSATGLEWLWRLIGQPSRWKRIMNAVIVFPLVAIWDKIGRV